MLLRRRLRNPRRGWRRLLGLLFPAALLPACGAAVAPTTSLEAAVHPAGDSADRACNVVLRSAAALTNPDGSFAPDCNRGGCWFAFNGTIDVATSTEATPSEVDVWFHTSSNPSWTSNQAFPSTGAAPGFQRYTFRLAPGTIPSGLGVDLGQAWIELVPYLSFSDGRVFDHNRNPGSLDNYRLSAANGWSIAADPANCPSVSTIRFERPWIQVQDHSLVQGGRLRVDYDLFRMPDCLTNSVEGFHVWDTVAFVEWSPAGQNVEQSLRSCTNDPTQPCDDFTSKPFVTPVPDGATRVQIWFESVGARCQTTWDSQYGQNYRYPVSAQ
jgi:hypothetical protein